MFEIIARLVRDATGVERTVYQGFTLKEGITPEGWTALLKAGNSTRNFKAFIESVWFYINIV